MVPQSQLPTLNRTPGDTQVIGLAGPGIRYYDSNGGTCYSGNYWLTPVTIGLSSTGGTMTSTVTTHPIGCWLCPTVIR